MGSSNADAAVAHGYHHFEVRAGELEACGIGEGSTVEAMEGVRGEKSVEQPGAADIAYHSDFVRVQAQFEKCPIQSVHALLMRASGAEDRGPVRIE